MRRIWLVGVSVLFWGSTPALASSFSTPSTVGSIPLAHYVAPQPIASSPYERVAQFGQSISSVFGYSSATTGEQAAPAATFEPPRTVLQWDGNGELPWAYGQLSFDPRFNWNLGGASDASMVIGNPSNFGAVVPYMNGYYQVAQ